MGFIPEPSSGMDRNGSAWVSFSVVLNANFVLPTTEGTSAPQRAGVGGAREKLSIC